MADLPRLNGIIKTLEQGKIAFSAFTPVDIEGAVALASSALDGVVFEWNTVRSTFPVSELLCSSCLIDAKSSNAQP